MKSNVFPDILKLADVSPNYKKSDNLVKGNYRPVSVLTTLSKLYESTMNDQLLSGEPDYFGRNKILSGYDLSHYQVPHCIRVFFYFVWFVFIHHNFQFYFKLCTYCNILDINLS